MVPTGEKQPARTSCRRHAAEHSAAQLAPPYSTANHRFIRLRNVSSLINLCANALLRSKVRINWNEGSNKTDQLMAADGNLMSSLPPALQARLVKRGLIKGMYTH